jgi:serine protease Do
MNSWYDRDDWYAPLETSGDDPGEEKKIRRQKRIRAFGALVILVALLGVTALSLTNLVKKTTAIRASSQAENTDNLPEEYPEEYKDFFSRFYTPVETKNSVVSIPRTDEKYDFSLKLKRRKESELTLQQLYRSCSPSIVAIAGYQKGIVGYNWGTGVVLSADGLILTNTHVIDQCDRAEVIFEDDVTYTASLIGADSTSDIALLKIDASGLPAAAFGDSAFLSVGDSVAAIGNPLGDDFTRTLTNGIISAIDRDVMHDGHKMTLLQTNTALNEGNSGGALFNMYGQVVGITNMKMISATSGIEGIGFAIPSSTVKTVVAALLADGEVKGRPSIGITVGEIPEEAAEKYDLPAGLYVASVTKGTDAWQQGVREGDIILEANGTPVVKTAELNDLKNKLQVGDSITLKLWRDGKELQLCIKLMDTNEVYR